jgi:succinate dehydrogenase flavin-adding protein (antitoxin of CptAB toxin-antitoxin module)
MKDNFEELLEKTQSPYYKVLQEVSMFYIINGHGGIDDDNADKLVKKLKKDFNITPKSRKENQQ